MQRPQYHSERPAPSSAALLSRPLSMQEGIGRPDTRLDAWMEYLRTPGRDGNADNAAVSSTCPVERRLPRFSPGRCRRALHPAPQAALPLCPGGRGGVRLTLAQQVWRTVVSGGLGWPSTLTGVFSPADKPAGRGRNGAAWRHFISQMCLSVHERETFTVLLLFKYFNASHLVSYF